MGGRKKGNARKKSINEFCFVSRCCYSEQHFPIIILRYTILKTCIERNNINKTRKKVRKKEKKPSKLLVQKAQKQYKIRASIQFEWEDRTRAKNEQIETVVRQEWIFRLVLELFYLGKVAALEKCMFVYIKWYQAKWKDRKRKQLRQKLYSFFELNHHTQSYAYTYTLYYMYVVDSQGVRARASEREIETGGFHVCDAVYTSSIATQNWYCFWKTIVYDVLFLNETIEHNLTIKFQQNSIDSV